MATWVYRWGFSSDFVIQRLLQKQATGWAAHATKRKLLRATSTASGVPRRLYTLATQGLELACQHAPKLLDYKEQDPLAINQATIRHELFASIWRYLCCEGPEPNMFYLGGSGRRQLRHG
ncbi:hypothetical protein [Ideonella paludis]|uniref:hypothetical protein n=1 Tax=Ideonella paludis TaxID=1233411 RepID=UPI00362CA910